MLKLFTFAQVAADSLCRHEEGQTMAEYGVVLAVITITVIGAITLLSDNVVLHDGTITLYGKAVTVHASGLVKVEGAPITLN